MSKEPVDFEELKEFTDDLERSLGREQERLQEELERRGRYLKVVQSVGALVSHNEELKAEIDDLKAENTDLHTQLQEAEMKLQEAEMKLQEAEMKLQEAEMKLSELSKLSAGVARKSSQEELVKALRSFVNKSKRKKMEKRAAVKEMVLELVVSNSLALPEDLAATIETLDDEQPEGKKIGQLVLEQNNYGVPAGLTAADDEKQLEDLND